MAITRDTQRWIALILLWTVVITVCWIVAVQAFLVLMSPFGVWRWPRIANVTVTRVEADPDNKLTDKVYADEEAKGRVLAMLKAEAAKLHTDDDIWILENYYVKGLRPDQFRLTPLRLSLEYPEPFFLLALWGIRRIRKAQTKAAKTPPSKPPTVWRDDFHKRAFTRESP
jgi:hypothetical protein